MIEIRRYQLVDGRIPLDDWLNGMRDKTSAAVVRMRIRRMEAGNFGDCKPVGEGVSELRMDIGAGYRLYHARHGKNLVILLCGGDKSSQQSDIRQAKTYWADWKRRQK
jgi:putative addiction module killer protein